MLHEATGCKLHKNISVQYMYQIEVGQEEAKFESIPGQAARLELAPVR